MKNRMYELVQKLRSNQSGFGMIELLVTIIILSIGIFSLMNLMANLVRADQFNTIDMISLNLAREGVEVVRNIRDSNWLAGQNWQAGLAQGNDYTAILDYDLTTDSWDFDFSIDSIDDEKTTLYYDANSNLYIHDTTDFKTQYKRIITLKPVCLDTASANEKIVRQEGQFCLTTEEKVGIEVHSQVRWQDPSSQKKRDKILVNTIYNWR